MKTITNFHEANQTLKEFAPKFRSEKTYTHDRMKTLMTYLGNPQDKLKIIHVAGTSGKTSTCYYLASLLKAAGQTVGLTVSPHLVEVNDRVQIDLVPLPEAEFCHNLTKFIDIIQKSGIKPSYFELMIAFAYWQFDLLKVDYAVIEVGLGGLLDPTNVVSNDQKVCVITDIGLDHTQILGNNVGTIASQKAGIIQFHNVVFCYRQATEIMASIQKRCQLKSAKLNVIDKAQPSAALDSLPTFQQRNCFLAIQTVDYVLRRDGLKPLQPQSLAKAVTVFIPGRMEIMHYQHKVIILDGAHNPQKLNALAIGIRSKYPDQSIASLISLVSLAELEDGRVINVARELRDLFSYLIITSFTNVQQDYHHNSARPEIVREAFVELGFRDAEIIDNPDKALTALLSRSEPILLITGSFYLLSYMRPVVIARLAVAT